MKKTHPWHETRIGAVVRFLGSIQMAVPVLVLVAMALAWGTYLDSTAGSKVARAIVYGSWWFLGLMVLICVSLVFAVVVRYPWQRRHVGFMTVHASLIAMIVGGFWSMFGRVEGHLPLEEGNSSAWIETDDERIELVQHQNGEFLPIDDVGAKGTVTLGGRSVQIVERWDNTREEPYVADDGADAFRAFEITFDTASGADWVGEESKSGGVSTLRGLRVRVLADGAPWEPPAKAEVGPAGYSFTVGDKHFPLAEEGQEAFPGWKIVSIKKFSRATVSGAGLTENEAGAENPAVDVEITDGRGTTERHTAFLNFPDMTMAKTAQGAAQSGARLTATPPGGAPETLVIYGPAGAPLAGYIGADGSVHQVPSPAGYPWVIDVGQRRLTVLRQFTHAHSATRFVKAPAATEHRPALLVRIGDDTELTVVAWKDMVPLPTNDGRQLMIRFAPRQVPLPFSVRLAKFRKTDYPGTDMAMAYESDVGVTVNGRPEQPFHIYMNHPYARGPWRVYQSGFMGDTISIFSVMRDPGLPLTYAGAVGLCVGIFLTFYARSLSWGHPGIPIEFTSASVSSPTPIAEPAHASIPASRVASAGGVRPREPLGAGSV